MAAVSFRPFFAAVDKRDKPCQRSAQRQSVPVPSLRVPWRMEIQCLTEDRQPFENCQSDSNRKVLVLFTVREGCIKIYADFCVAGADRSILILWTYINALYDRLSEEFFLYAVYGKFVKIV